MILREPLPTAQSPIRDRRLDAARKLLMDTARRAMLVPWSSASWLDAEVDRWGKRRILVKLTAIEVARCSSRPARLGELVLQRFLDAAHLVVDDWDAWVNCKLEVRRRTKLGLADDAEWMFWPVPATDGRKVTP